MPRKRVGDAGAGDIGGAKAAIGCDARGQRIGDARQDQRGAGLEHGAELLAGGNRHRVQCAGTPGEPQGIATSRDQHHGTGGLARLDVAVCLRRLAQADSFG